MNFLLKKSILGVPRMLGGVKDQNYTGEQVRKPLELLHWELWEPAPSWPHKCLCWARTMTLPLLLPLKAAVSATKLSDRVGFIQLSFIRLFTPKLPFCMENLRLNCLPLFSLYFAFHFNYWHINLTIYLFTNVNKYIGSQMFTYG